MYNHDEYRIIHVTESNFLSFFSSCLLSMLKLYSIRSLVLLPTIISPFLTLMHYTVTHQLAISQFLTFNTPKNGSIYLKFTHRLVKIRTNMFSHVIPTKSSGIIIQAILRNRELNCYISYIIVIFILSSKFLCFIHQRTFKLRKCLGF